MLRRIALLATASTLLRAQTPTVLRTETRVVQIQVEVADSHGKPMGGLTKEDFSVTDSGRAREIRIFSVDGGDDTDRPRRPAAMMPPNVFSNQTPAPRPGHATVILLDAINNYWDDFAAARLRLIDMVGKLRNDDPIAIYAATTRPASIVVVQDFTADRNRLLSTIRAYRPPTIEPAPGMVPPPPPPPAEEDLRRRTAMLDTMSAFRLLSEHLAKLPGRKSLLWLTSGLPPKQLREFPDPFEKAAAALNEANVAVHVMDDDGVGSPKRRWGSSAYDTLRQLADATGGKAYLGRNDLDNMVAEAIQNERITYTLGFYLPDEERDDKFHPLQVRVNRPKVQLSYRKGYYAGAIPTSTSPKKREPLENALRDAQDSSDVSITAEVVRIPAAPRYKLRVSMQLGFRDLTIHDANGSWSGKIEEMFLETKAAGQVVARIRDTKEFKVSQRMREQFEATGIPVRQEIDVVDTATRLLIVVRDSESGRTGSLSVPLSPQ